MWNYIVLWYVIAPVEPNVGHQAPPEAWQALKTISLHLEVVGPHENWASDFRSELRYVRHYARTLQNAPRLVDTERLPPPCVATEFLRFNEAYQCHLANQQLMLAHRADDVGDALGEARQLHRIWDAVRRSSATNQAWAYRRRTLCQLREMVGEEAFANGKLPPCVPVWRFREID